LNDNGRADIPGLIIRSAIGGTMMGLANLVPGISGGTMLLAAGVYPQFINGVAEVSTLRFRLRSILTLSVVVIAAALAILLFAGAVKDLVVYHRWIMYSLFVGLTLGGVPVLWKLIKKLERSVVVGALAGFAAMAIVAIFQQHGAAGSVGGESSSDVPMLFVAGAAGASAMILPGVSGGYLLLVLGQYVPILTAIDVLKDALQVRDMAVAFDVALKVCMPVGLGVVIGIVGVSNGLKVLLRRFPKATYGVLLGLLFGAVVGLWPFQRGVCPQAGDILKGRVVTVERLAEIDQEDYPTQRFTPSAKQACGSFGIILVGFAATFVLSRFGASD